MDMQKYYKQLSDTWKFSKPYFEKPPKTEDDWKRFINEAEDLTKKHDEEPFIVAMVRTVIEEMERVNC